MSYLCEIGDKLNLNKKNQPKSLTNVQYEKSIRINHTVKNLDFFDIDKILNNYITNHNKKFDSYLFKCEF